MRWMPLWAVALGCQTPPARDPADVERIRALEQRVSMLEAQLAKPVPAAEPATKPPPVAPPDVARPAPIRRGFPDPATAYNVPLDDNPTIGPAAAPVTVVAVLQFPEPYTHKVMPTLEQLLREYPRDVRIVIKQYIVPAVHHFVDRRVRGAAYQGAVVSMESAICQAVVSMSPRLGVVDPAQPGVRRQVVEAELRELARALRLDLEEYDRDFGSCTAAQVRDRPMLEKLGQHAVPGFWINGRYLSGAQPIESFRRLIDEEREKWKVDKASGGKAATYYDRVTAGAPTAP